MLELGPVSHYTFYLFFPALIIWWIAVTWKLKHVRQTTNRPYCSVYFVPVLLDYIQSHVLAHIILICTEHGAMFLCSGEWVNEWDVQNASQYEYQKFGRAQLDVYANATFGWSYWTIKNDMIHWDFEWNIQNKYLLFSKYTGHANHACISRLLHQWSYNSEAMTMVKFVFLWYCPGIISCWFHVCIKRCYYYFLIKALL